MEATRLRSVWLVSVCFIMVCFTFNGCCVYCTVAMTSPMKTSPTVDASGAQLVKDVNSSSISKSLLISNGSTVEYKQAGKLDIIKEAEIMLNKDLVFQENPFGYPTDEEDEDLDEETDEVLTNGNFEMVNFRRRSLYDPFTMSDRLKRHIFGRDSRLFVPAALTETFPFSAIVRLLPGCTGTLIWYKHVLTSAHCIHDGKNFMPFDKLKVGISRGSGTFKWFKVKKAFVANQWLRKKGLKRLGHDYAVLVLTKKHGRPYMPFGPHPLRPRRWIQFAGFPSDKAINQMWFTQCSIIKLSKRILYNTCDAWPGMSGSGVYVYNKQPPAIGDGTKDYRKVVAIFSSFRGRVGKDGKFVEGHNVATRLTKKKVERICNWIKAGRGCRFLR